MRTLGRDPFKLISKQHQDLYNTLAKIELESKLKRAKSATTIATNGNGHAGKTLTNGNGKPATNGSTQDEDEISSAPNTITINDSTTADNHSGSNGVKDDEGLNSTQDVNMKSLNGDDGEEKTGSQEGGKSEAMVVLD